MSDLKAKQQLRIRKMWVDALRSGEYTQCTGRLRRNERFCCLGVLADLFVKEGHGKWESWSDPYEDRRYRMDGLDGTLSPKIAGWVGLKSSGGYIDKARYDNESESLFAMNDVDGMNFDEIADVIESEPDGLFGRPSISDEILKG